MTAAPLPLDSITDAKENAAGEIVVSGSHGGLYAATLASRAAVRAVVFSDAGIGLEGAGVAGVLAMAEVGMAAAAADYRTCRIGSAEDILHRGRISVTNRVAADLGVVTGMRVAEAVSCLSDATTPRDRLPMQQESRRQVLLEPSNTPVRLLDSASLVRPKDRGQILVIGSHGGLVGGDPSRSLKAVARIAVFNDAGIGIDEAGIARLPVLDRHGIAGITVDCMTARIGDAASTLQTGKISRCNENAKRLDAEEGLSLKDWLSSL